MGSSSLGTIAGQIKLDASQALAAFAATRAAGHETSSSLGKASGSMKLFGGITLAAGGAIVAGFALAIKAAADFDVKMSYIGAVTKATGAEMDQVRAKALQLGRDGQFSAGQIAEGFVELAKAGVSVNDMTGIMSDSMVNLASAANVDLKESVETIVSVLHTYNISAKDSAHVTDVLSGTMHASVLSLSDVASTMKYAGAVARALGISFDSVSAATAILGKAGIKGSSAGTQLRQIIVSLSGATKPARKELEALGIMTKSGANEFFTSAGKAKSLAEVFQILQDHTKGLTQQQQLMAFRTIFNNRALASAEILTKAGAAGFAEMNAQISKTSAANVASEKLNNLSGDIQKLKGSIDTMLIKAGEPLQKYMRGIVQFINKVVNAFVSLSPATQNNIFTFLGVAAAILVFIGSVALIAGTVLKVLSVFKEMYTTFKLVAAGIRIASLAFGQLSLTLLTNPVFLVVIAVIALAFAIYEAYQHCKPFRDIIDAIGRGLKTGFIATINWFKSLPGFFLNLWKDIEHWFSVGVGWVKKNWDILLVIFTGPIGLIVLIVRRFGGTIVNFFQSIPGAVTKFLGECMTSTVKFLKNLPYEFGYALGLVIGTIVRWGINANKWFTKMAIDCYHALVDFFTKLPGEVMNWLNGVNNSINQFNARALAAIEKWCIDTYHAIIDFFTKLPGETERFFTSMYQKAVKSLNEFNAATIRFAVQAYNGIIDWFSKLPGRVENYFIDLYHRAVNQFNSLVSSASHFGSSVYNGFMSFINQIPGAVSGAIDSAINSFESMISDAFNVAAKFAKGLWDGFKKGLGINSPSLIEKQMVQITKVTGAETKKLGGHVQMMQRLAGQISTINPAISASKANTDTISKMTADMKRQAIALQNAGVAVFGPQMASRLATTGADGQLMSPSSSGMGLESSRAGASINVNVYNPVAEKASDSTARKLRTLTSMGAF